MSRKIIKALEDLALEKKLPKNLIVQTLEAALISAYKKNFPNSNNVRVMFDEKSNEFKVFSVWKVESEEERFRKASGFYEKNIVGQNAKLKEILETEDDEDDDFDPYLLEENQEILQNDEVDEDIDKMLEQDIDDELEEEDNEKLSKQFIEKENTQKVIFKYITLEDALKIDKKAVPGAEVLEEVTPKDFGRIAMMTAKQVITQRIKEAEKEQIFNLYHDRIGEIVSGRVQRVSKGSAFIELEGTTGRLEATEQIEGEYYNTNPNVREYLKFLVLDVRDPSLEIQENQEEDNKKSKKKKDRSIQVDLSRANSKFLEKLLELEVPEVADGVVEIVSVARHANKSYIDYDEISIEEELTNLKNLKNLPRRSKVAVRAADINIDAIGACVGPRGTRIQRIVNELKGERIDIISYSDDIKKFIANALSPAKVEFVDIVDEENKKARAVVKDENLTLAIGTAGQNVKLAADLCSWKIDIKTLSEYQMIESDEFNFEDDSDEYIESHEDDEYLDSEEEYYDDEHYDEDDEYYFDEENDEDEYFDENDDDDYYDEDDEYFDYDYEDDYEDGNDDDVYYDEDGDFEYYDDENKEYYDDDEEDLKN